jgi:Arm domain-containing DNA-binding protein
MALTDTRLPSLRPTGSRYELPDRDGLVLRVSQRGVMTWAAYYRVQGKGNGAGVRLARLSGPKQRFTLGQYPAMSLARPANMRSQSSGLRGPGLTRAKHSIRSRRRLSGCKT